MDEELDLCADQKNDRRFERRITKDLTLADLDNHSEGESSGLSDTSDEEFNPEPARFGYEASKELQKNKIVTEAEIKVLAKEYQSDVYDFRVEGGAYDKRMKEQGIVAPDGSDPQSIVYKFYFQAIRNIIKLVLINLVLNAAPIYILAIIN